MIPQRDAAPAAGGSEERSAGTPTPPDTRPLDVPAASTPESWLRADLAPEDRTAVAALPPGSALLVAHPGPGAGQRFLLHGDLTSVGRLPVSDIFLDDVTVSRRHATVVRQGGRFVVRDLGSLNGTYVNALRVDEAVLFAGDVVRIGKYQLAFHPSPADGGTQVRR